MHPCTTFPANWFPWLFSAKPLYGNAWGMRLDIVPLKKAVTFLRVTSSSPEGCLRSAQNVHTTLSSIVVRKKKKILWSHFVAFINKKKKNWVYLMDLLCFKWTCSHWNTSKHDNLKLNHRSGISFGFMTQFLPPFHRFRHLQSGGTIFNHSFKIGKHNFIPNVSLKVMMAARI